VIPHFKTGRVLKYWGISCITFAVILLSACEKPAPKVSSAERGKILFNQPYIGKSSGCIMCHSFSADTVTVGPSLLGIAIRAGITKKNMTAKDYLYESITNPDAYIVNGYEPNIMYTGYADELSKEQLADIINFLLSQ